LLKNSEEFISSTIACIAAEYVSETCQHQLVSRTSSEYEFVFIAMVCLLERNTCTVNNQTMVVIIQIYPMTTRYKSTSTKHTRILWNCERTPT